MKHHFRLLFQLSIQNSPPRIGVVCMLRSPVVGCKNGMFAGCEGGAKAAAVFFSSWPRLGSGSGPVGTTWSRHAALGLKTL